MKLYTEKKMEKEAGKKQISDTPSQQPRFLQDWRDFKSRDLSNRIDSIFVL